MENVILTNIINNVDGTSVAFDVWQMECDTDNMADGKGMYADHTT